MPSLPIKHDRRTIFAGLAGNVMEWFDFALYGYFAVVIGQQFFPSQNHVTSLLAAFGVFASGFMARPVGAAFFGHLGDRKGRVVVLRWSVFLMGASTFLLGVLPTYHSIGFAAQVLLTVLRIVQGFSVGGEFTGSLIFMTERSAPNRRGLMGAFVFVGGISGILLGSGAGALINATLSAEQVASFGWRIPFLAGIGITLMAALLRNGLEPDAEVIRREASPLKMAIRYEWRTILRIVGLFLLGGIGFYMMFLYVTTYEHEQFNLPAAKALEINTAAMVALVLLAPCFGWISDRIGRKPVLWFGSLGCVLFAIPLFMLLRHSDPWLIFLGQLGFAVLMGATIGPSTASMVEMTPPERRCTVISLGYNLTISAFGGTTPIMATWLISETGNPMTPAYYLIGAALVTALTLLVIPESYRAEVKLRGA